jgi:hypothetical protein
MTACITISRLWAESMREVQKLLWVGHQQSPHVEGEGVGGGAASPPGLFPWTLAP